MLEHGLIPLTLDQWSVLGHTYIHLRLINHHAKSANTNQFVIMLKQLSVKKLFYFILLIIFAQHSAPKFISGWVVLDPPTTIKS